MSCFKIKCFVPGITAIILLCFMMSCIPPPEEDELTLTAVYNQSTATIQANYTIQATRTAAEAAVQATLSTVKEKVDEETEQTVGERLEGSGYLLLVVIVVIFIAGAAYLVWRQNAKGQTRQITAKAEQAETLADLHRAAEQKERMSKE